MFYTNTCSLSRRPTIDRRTTSSHNTVDAVDEFDNKLSSLSICPNRGMLPSDSMVTVCP